MLAGHLGAALALKKVERRLNLGILVLAALALDVLLWAFVLIGWETVQVPADFSTRRQLAFEFPFSHGLMAAAGWSLVAAALATLAWRHRAQQRQRLALVVGLAVFSHWLLDVLVHVPEIPVLGAASAKLGLSLWEHLPVALVVESGIALAGLWLFLAGSALPRGRRIATISTTVFVMLLTILGMTIAPAPPSGVEAAASSLALIAALTGLFAWLDRDRTNPAATATTPPDQS